MIDYVNLWVILVSQLSLIYTGKWYNPVTTRQAMVDVCVPTICNAVMFLKNLKDALLCNYWVILFFRDLHNCFFKAYIRRIVYIYIQVIATSRKKTFVTILFAVFKRCYYASYVTVHLLSSYHYIRIVTKAICKATSLFLLSSQSTT